MKYVSASKIKNNFGKYLDMALVEGEVNILRYKRVVAKIVANTKDNDVENNEIIEDKKTND